MARCCCGGDCVPQPLIEVLAATASNTCETIPDRVQPSAVDTFSTRQIAEHANVSISTVLRHAVRLDIKPVFELPGVRGAKLWDAGQRHQLLESIARTETAA